MIWSVGGATRIYLLAGVTDLRRGFDGLYGLVESKLEEDPLSGHLFLFCNRNRTRLKGLIWDGSGLCVCAKRLDRGCFSWPQVAEGKGKVRLNPEELALLVGGIELTGTRAKKWWRGRAESSVDSNIEKDL